MGTFGDFDEASAVVKRAKVADDDHEKRGHQEEGAHPA